MTKNMTCPAFLKKFLLIFSVFLIPVFSYSEFYICGGPMIHAVYSKAEESAPNPVTYSVGAGGILFSQKKLNIDFSGIFYSTYYDYTKNGDVVFTEVENRTALGFGLFTECTARYNFVKGNHRLTVGGGLGLLWRFAIKSDGVGSDEDYKVSKINDSFWQNGSFIYPEIAACWLYNCSEKIQAGLETKILIGFSQTKVSFAFKIAFGSHDGVYKTEEESVKVKSDSGTVSGESL